MCTRSMGDTGLFSFNSLRENTKGQHLVILELQNGDFGPLSQKKEDKGTHGHTMEYCHRAEFFNTVLNSCGTGG
jgi:hypothetical protein